MDDATAFREVLAQWHLAARTEVKRASSLPSSMFQTCDPMLEARLAESVEAMMRCLHRPDLKTLARNASGEHLAPRTEDVDAAAIAALVTRAGQAPGRADVDEGLAGEYLNLLVDTCTTGTDEVQRAARELLRRDFDVDPDGDLDRACVALVTCLSALGDDRSDDRDADLEQLCHRVAATAFVRSQADEGRR